jgi:membrane peptidoglycan carboxypeptidase
VNAYGAIANGGVHHDSTIIMKVEDKDGKIREQYRDNPGQRVVEEKYVAMLDHIMSTNEYRAPVFGDNNPFKFSDRPVAAKTGTTNEFRDGWAMGFTPSIAVGVWAGNNDNSSMKVGADGIYVAAPIWRAFMNQALGNSAVEQFPKYEKEDAGKPVLNGEQNIKEDVKVCKMDAKDYKGEYCLANDSCPEGTGDKKTFGDLHDILYYVNKSDPRGDAPKDPKSDSQYKNWEKGVQEWFNDNKKKKNKDLEPMPTLDCKAEYFKVPEPEPAPEPVVVPPVVDPSVLPVPAL